MLTGLGNKRVMQGPVSLAPRTIILALAALGSLAALVAAGGPSPPDCRAEQLARETPEPGFVALAGNGDAACLSDQAASRRAVGD